MKRVNLHFLTLVTVLAALAGGCSKSTDSAAIPSATPPKPREAASQLHQAFAAAPVEVRQSAQAASEALQTANYEQAIQTLQRLRMRTELTPEQGMAIHSSERSLEAGLIAAMEAGDPKAKQAYELLKKSHRN